MQATGTDKVPAVPTWPNLDAGLWQAIGGLLWIVLALVVLFALRTEIAGLFRALVLRVKTGAALKIFSLEFGPIRVSSNTLPSGGSISAVKDLTDEWHARREQVYKDNGQVFIAHRLFPSEVKGQLYDVLIYLVPHRSRGASLRGIERVEYYFGGAWGNTIFGTSDSGNRFGIVVSAYGSGFLCVAKVFYHDRQPVETWRYVDFEMGPLGEGGEEPGSAA